MGFRSQWMMTLEARNLRLARHWRQPRQNRSLGGLHKRRHPARKRRPAERAMRLEQRVHLRQNLVHSASCAARRTSAAP